MFAPNNIWYVFIGKGGFIYSVLAHEISIDIRFPHFFAWNFITTLVHLMSWAHKYYRRSVGLNCKELEYIRSIIQIRWRQQKWLWSCFYTILILKMWQVPNFSNPFLSLCLTADLSRTVDPFAWPGFLHQSGGFGWMSKRVYICSEVW